MFFGCDQIDMPNTISKTTKKSVKIDKIFLSELSFVRLISNYDMEVYIFNNGIKIYTTSFTA